MKNQIFNSKPLNVWIYMLMVIFLSSCNSTKWIIPPEYAGQWETSKERITVRTKFKKEPFKFTSDSAIVVIKINENKTVSGFIGLAKFENGKLKKNASLPWETGVEYIIECGSIGKIFSNDPMESKEVEIWFGPLNSEGISKSELRYTQGAALFPMGRLLFMKVKD